MNATDIHGLTPLDLAVQSEEPECARLVHEAGGYPHKVRVSKEDLRQNAHGLEDEWDKMDRLIADGQDAAACTHLVKTLLVKYPHQTLQLRDEDPPHWSLLHKSAFFGQPEASRILIENGADLQTRDANGNRPLELARFGSSPDHALIADLMSERMSEERATSRALRVSQGKKAVTSAQRPHTSDGGGGSDGVGGGVGTAGAGTGLVEVPVEISRAKGLARADMGVMSRGQA